MEAINMAIIPKAAAEKILKQAGAERISADAKDALVAYMEKAGLDAAEKAIKMAAVAKRKTIKAEDIELATE